jgi:hypothetical protein
MIPPDRLDLLRRHGDPPALLASAQLDPLRSCYGQPSEDSLRPDFGFILSDGRQHICHQSPSRCREVEAVFDRDESYLAGGQVVEELRQATGSASQTIEPPDQNLGDPRRDSGKPDRYNARCSQHRQGNWWRMGQIDPVAISIVAMAVAVVALLFGPAIVPRGWAKYRSRALARDLREVRIIDYLSTACVFMDGLLLFFEQTWGWGPSVPNYSAGGSFPTEPNPPEPQLQPVCSAVREALALYDLNSKKEGRAYPSKDELLGQWTNLHGRFWAALEEYVRREWPWRGSGVFAELRRLRIPDAERQRIEALNSSF